MKFLFAFGVSAIALALPSILFASPLEGPLVPACEGPTCTVCHFVELGRNLLKFGVAFASLVAIGLFIYIGIMHAAGTVKYANVAKAQKSLAKVIFGFILLLSAWILLDVGISVFTGKGIRPWTDFSCNSLQFESIYGGRPRQGFGSLFSFTEGPLTTDSSQGRPGELSDDTAESTIDVNPDPNVDTTVLSECISTTDADDIPRIPEGATYDEGIDFLRAQEAGIIIYPEVYYVYTERDGVEKWEFGGAGSDTCIDGTEISRKVEEAIDSGASTVRIVHTHTDDDPDGSPPSPADIATCTQLKREYGSRIDVQCIVVDGSGNEWSIEVDPESNIDENILQYGVAQTNLFGVPAVRQRAVEIASENPDMSEAQIIAQVEQEAFEGKLGAEAQRKAGELRRMDAETGMGKIFSGSLTPDELTEELKKRGVTLTRTHKAAVPGP